jgi:hypothetical protein
MSKGKPKPRIHDLSRTPPTREELDQVWDILTAPADPIATAVLGSALVEHGLEQRLRKRFKRNDDVHWKEMTGDKGPVGTFYAQIVIGYALAMYDDKMRDALDTIRTIRNQFAHAKRPINFGEDLIHKELAKVRIRTRLMKEFLESEPKDVAGRYAYVWLCMHISNKFSRMETKSLQQGTRRLEKKIAKMSPLAQALTRSLGSPSPESPAFGQLALLGQKIGDPTPLSQLPYARGLLDFFGKPESKSDK